MLPNIHSEAFRQALYIAGILVANVLISGISWRLVGTKRRGTRLIGRLLAAFFALTNGGVVLGGVFFLLRGGVDWFYAALVVVGFVFAYRIGGATIGRYP